MLKNMSRLNEIPRYLDKRVFQRIFQIAEINNLTKEEREMYEASLKEKCTRRSFLQPRIAKLGKADINSTTTSI